MPWVVNIVLLLVVLLAGALLAVVVVPFRAQAVGELTDENMRGAVVGSWCFGLIGVFAASERGVFLLLFGRPVWRIPPQSEEKKAEKKAKKEEKRRRKKAEKKKPSTKTVRDRLDWLADHQSTLRRVARRILQTAKLRLRVEGTVGLDDPADTAVLVTALRGIGQLGDPGWIDVQPDYLDDTVDLAGEVSSRLWVLAILWAALRSLFEINTWRMLRGLT